ncbi:hypothetical protein SAMN06297144_1628 [Sphingomonas guangdongensis]|uniref:17 kDa surface antigen n=1 Tax=Sphingomonas guangdongensis TaxID=1141890 RepID=A0A285R2F0_9SPHN|nr:hypothetical protein [Sphingomonas guangdongensis]SOB86522.1 hypothetical protein SAMN06297144_1628 [Sphingomonas guangdongensis]
MRDLLKKATLGVALGASALTVAAPAEAQRWGRYRHHRGDNTGTAIVAGIAGLAIGAALTSRDRYDPRYDYDYRFYDRRGYFPNDGYYARRYYNDGYYNDGYYNRGGYYGGYNRCVVRRVYDPYIGRRVRVRYC